MHVTLSGIFRKNCPDSSIYANSWKSANSVGPAVPSSVNRHKIEQESLNKSPSRLSAVIFSCFPPNFSFCGEQRNNLWADGGSTLSFVQLLSNQLFDWEEIAEDALLLGCSLHSKDSLPACGLQKKAKKRKRKQRWGPKYNLRRFAPETLNTQVFVFLPCVKLIFADPMHNCARVESPLKVESRRGEKTHVTQSWAKRKDRKKLRVIQKSLSKKGKVWPK